MSSGGDVIDKGTQGYTYDPFTGLPIADPSGVLQSGGYQTQAADAALAVGDAAKDYILKWGKILVYGTIIVVGLVVVAEAVKLGRGAFGR